MNGLIQSILSGIVPANYNADNIEKKLMDIEHIVFLNEPLYIYGFNAGILKSFGFGQVGEVLVVDYVLAQIPIDELKILRSETRSKTKDVL